MAAVEIQKSTPTSKLGKALVALAVPAVFFAPILFAWSFWQGLGFIVLGLIAIAVVAGIWGWRLRPMCLHGVRGGAQGGECVACDTELARKLKSKELYEKELDRLQKGRLATEATIRQMDPFQFETMVCNLYRALGYDVKQTPSAADGGRDAIMTKDGCTELLEVKLHAAKVGRPALQKFHSAMMTDAAVVGHFVAPGGFSKHSYEFAEANGIELVGMQQLLDLSAQVGWGTASMDHYSYLCVSCGHYGTMPLVAGPKWNASKATLEIDAPCGQCGSPLDNHITRSEAEYVPRALHKPRYRR